MAAASGLLPGDWAGYRNRQDKGAFNQDESILTPATVSGLHVVDTLSTGDFILRDGQAGATAHGLFYTRIADGSESLAAYDATTDQLRWTSFPGSNHIALGDDAVYTISEEEQLGPVGHVSAHDATTGSVLWQVALNRLREVTSPVLSGGTLVVSYSALRNHAVTGVVRAFNAATGHQLWQRSFAANSGISGPSVNSGVVFVSVSGTLTALDVRTGKTKWSLAGENVGIRPLVASGGLVYAATQSGRVLALKGTTGKQVWAKSGFPIDTSGLALGQGLLFVPLFPEQAADPDLVAFDAGNGSVRWSADVGFGATAPVVAGNVLYALVGGLQGGLASVRALTGQPISLFPIAGNLEPASEPMVSHGRIYLADNELHVIQVLGP